MERTCMYVSLGWSYSEKFRIEVATVTRWCRNHVGDKLAANVADVWLWLVSYSRRFLILFSASKCITAIHTLPSVFNNLPLDSARAARRDRHITLPSHIAFILWSHAMWLRMKQRETVINPYPTAFPYGNGMVLHFYQQQESSTTKTVHKVINKRLKACV